MGEANAGILVLDEGSEPVHVPWAEVKRIDFDGAKTKLSDPNHRSLP